MTEEPRVVALRVLGEVLAGRVAKVGDLRRGWPRADEPGDFLLRRARQEAEHYLLTRGDLERRIVRMVARFLEHGGTPAELERAYDAVIRGHE